MVLTSPKKLDLNKATGSDGIPVCLLKKTADQITPSVTMLFNKSLWLVIFPGDWKLTNIVHIFKKRKRDFVENYRPISLLPFISKVLERCVLVGLQDHISHLISCEQHGFLASKSCVTQLTSVLHYNGSQLDVGKQIDILYLDMSKAFDKVDHTKLLGRLHQYGITDNLNNWFHSYRDASNRLQFSEPLSENCRLHLGYHKGPYQGRFCFCCLWMIHQTLLRH